MAMYGMQHSPTLSDYELEPTSPWQLSYFIPGVRLLPSIRPTRRPPQLNLLRPSFSDRFFASCDKGDRYSWSLPSAEGLVKDLLYQPLERLADFTLNFNGR